MKICAVITSRNDNYGGNLTHRAKLSLVNFIERYDEVIYVDWNSHDKSLIEEIRKFLPKKNKLTHVLITTNDVKNLDESYSSI